MEQSHSSFIGNIRDIGMVKEAEIKTIRLRVETYNLLTDICRKDQTYDEAVLSLVKEHNGK